MLPAPVQCSVTSRLSSLDRHRGIPDGHVSTLQAGDTEALSVVPALRAPLCSIRDVPDDASLPEEVQLATSVDIGVTMTSSPSPSPAPRRAGGRSVPRPTERGITLLITL